MSVCLCVCVCVCVSQVLKDEPVLHDDFDQALDRIKPSVSPTDIKKHEEWCAEFGSA